MGREVQPGAEVEDEDEQIDEDEEFEFAADAGVEDWTDPSEDGALAQLFIATEAGALDAVQQLLLASPSARLYINSLGPEGDTCLHLAALYGHHEIFEALLRAGADPAVKDDNASTPLHDASAGGYLPIVQRLLALCPQLVREQDDDQETALHCAARGGFPEVVAALLAAGSDKAHVNAEGRTPLQVVDAADAATAALLA